MTWRWLPNAICVVRLLLVVPVVVLLLQRRYGAALVLFMIAGASDAIDGFLAKRFAWQSRLGSLLDPAADKLLVVSVFVSLAYLGLIPAALAAVVVLRDAVIVLGALTYQLVIEPLEGQPTAVSKLNTACQLGFVVFTLVHEITGGWPARISLLVLGAAVVFTSITSGLNYVVGWSKRAWQVRHRAAS
ncbi:MAG TPA: CDP-alcohol phosphatidyltransferase family protein [Gammaproteobacteria bacterium]